MNEARAVQKLGTFKNKWKMDWNRNGKVFKIWKYVATTVFDLFKYRKVAVQKLLTIFNLFILLDTC